MNTRNILHPSAIPPARTSPTLLRRFAWKSGSFYFGGASLLIIVVVTMDFMTQVQAYLVSQQYESLLRKANFKAGVPTR